MVCRLNDLYPSRACPDKASFGAKYCKKCVWYNPPPPKRPFPKQTGKGLFDLAKT